jgi:ABC-type multidrug transport system ATPase subunit
MQILLEVKNVKKRYGSFEALKGVSLQLYPGEIVSLLGVNGAGKTTLSSIIATLHPLSEGDIYFKGESIYQDITTYRQQMSYCPQKPNLNNRLTLRENLVFAGRYFGLSHDTIQLRIATLAKQLKFERYLDMHVDELSGGYKQRFLIARSIMHTPQIIIFDEPTVALDPHIRREIWECIKLLKSQGVCVLLTTHYLDEAEYLSDRVCILDKGVIRLIDTPANLIKSFESKNLEHFFLQLMQESSHD